MSTNKSLAKSLKPTLSYALFLHKTQLKIRKKRLVGRGLPLIKSKLLVTDTLISQTKVQNDWDFEDLMKEKIYSNRLKLALFRVLSQNNSLLMQKKIYSNRLKLALFRVLSQNNSLLMQKKEKDFRVAVTRGREDDDEVNNPKRQKLTNNAAMREMNDIKKKIQTFTDKSFVKSHKPSLGYTLFMHQMQLRIPKKRSFGRCLPMLKSKLLVTDTLISQTKVQSDMDYEALKQEQIFSDFLKLCIVRSLSNRERRNNSKAVIRGREDDDEVNNPKRQRLTSNEVPRKSTEDRKSSRSA